MQSIYGVKKNLYVAEIEVKKETQIEMKEEGIGNHQLIFGVHHLSREIDQILITGKNQIFISLLAFFLNKIIYLNWLPS